MTLTRGDLPLRLVVASRAAPTRPRNSQPQTMTVGPITRPGSVAARPQGQGRLIRTPTTTNVGSTAAEANGTQVCSSRG